MTGTDGEAIARALSDPTAARLWLGDLGVRDPERGRRDLRDLAASGLSAGAMDGLIGQLGVALPQCPDPGMALTNLGRFAASGPDGRAALESLPGNPRTTDVLVQLFSTSQYFSELLIRDPRALDWLRGGAERRDRSALIDHLWGELRDAANEDEAKVAIRRLRHREMLRIGYSDVIKGHPLELTTLDLSHLADACVEGATRLARRQAEAKYGEPIGPDGTPSRFVVLALGKLGGEELNYSSDIDLIFLYDSDDGRTSGDRPVSNAEFFARMGGSIVRLLSDHSAMGQAYRVDMRLRPEGDQGPLARIAPLDPGLLPDQGPDLGAPGPDQVPADRGGPRRWGRTSSPQSPRSSIAGTWAPRRSARSRR